MNFKHIVRPDIHINCIPNMVRKGSAPASEPVAVEMGNLPPPTFDLENWANNYEGVPPAAKQDDTH